jgi:hypothetical protein
MSSRKYYVWQTYYPGSVIFDLSVIIITFFSLLDQRKKTKESSSCSVGRRIRRTGKLLKRLPIEAMREDGRRTGCAFEYFLFCKRSRPFGCPSADGSSQKVITHFNDSTIQRFNIFPKFDICLKLL